MGNYAFRNPVDIGNLALQMCGSPHRIDVSEGLNEDSLPADEVRQCYDALRQGELRRNTWVCSIKRAVLRAIDTDTMFVTPTMWGSTTTYRMGSLVSDEQNRTWLSLASQNQNNAPGNSFAWAPYFGPLTADAYDTSSTYSTGELVYSAPGDGTYTVFMALIDSPTEAPTAASAFDSTKTYQKDDVVTVASTPYISLVNLNVGNAPASSPTQWSTSVSSGTGSNQWREVGVALEPPFFAYPIGSGPLSQQGSRNVYRLPANYLGRAPQNPKQGSYSLLGAPTNRAYSDWDYEGEYLISADVGPILFRFVADVTEVTKFDPMFCNALAALVAAGICVAVTQSDGKLQTIASRLRLSMSEARQKNAIEVGAEEDPLDDYLACRV